jgi:hypothetical protein
LGTFDKPVLGIYIPIVAITLYHYFKNRKQQAAQRLILGYSLAMGLLTIGNYFTTTISMEALLVETPAGTPAAANAANLMAAPGSSMTSMCTPINTIANIILTLQYLLGDALMVFPVARARTASAHVSRSCIAYMCSTGSGGRSLLHLLFSGLHS